jgi:hypothetical protein
MYYVILIATKEKKMLYEFNGRIISKTDVKES